jgi:hypothetical protein
MRCNAAKLAEVLSGAMDSADRPCRDIIPDRRIRVAELIAEIANGAVTV